MHAWQRPPQSQDQVLLRVHVSTPGEAQASLEMVEKMWPQGKSQDTGATAEPEDGTSQSVPG